MGTVGMPRVPGIQNACDKYEKPVSMIRKELFHTDLIVSQKRKCIMLYPVNIERHFMLNSLNQVLGLKVYP